jgi:gamma-polyglutamate biosynthesis protein CapC
MNAIEPEVAVLALALGLVFGLVCYLLTNLSPGGMITPGWLGLALIQKPSLALLVGGVVVLTYAAIWRLQRIVILYGKRLFATVVLAAIFFQITAVLLVMPDTGVDAQTTTLGFVVPGLIAYQLLRQPVAATLTATASVTSLAYVIVLVGVKLRFIETTGPDVAAESLAAPALNPSLLDLVLLSGGTALGFVALAALLGRVPRRSVIQNRRAARNATAQ